jgi:copper(I)-binding protein
MKFVRCTVLATALFAAVAAYAQTAVKVDGAWARPTVQGQNAGGGFLRITGGATADRLLSVSSGAARTVELHTMAMEGDVMRMRRVDGIAVGAGQVVELKPGGMHLMLMGLSRPLKSGDSFPLTLRFEKAGDLKVEVKVMQQAGMPAMPDMPAGHGEHKH